MTPKTPKTYTFELTAEQAEDIFGAINAAQIYYGERIKQLAALSGYEMSYSVAGRIRGLELLREGARQCWIEFYQQIEPVRAAEKGGAA